MQWFYDLKISTKLILAFLFILILALLVGMYALFHLKKVNYASTIMEVNWLPSAVITSKISTHIAHIRIAEALHVHAISNQDKAFYEKDMESHLQKITKHQESYVVLVTGAEEAKLYQAFTQAWKAYLSEHNALMQLSREGNSQQARMMLSRVSARSFTEITQALDKLVEWNINGAVRASHHADHLYERARLWITGVLSLMLLSGLALAIIISRYIATYIKRFDEAMEKMATGDLNLQLATTSQDEFGHFTLNLNRAMRSTREMVAKISLAEASLRQSQQQLELFFSQSVAGFFFVDFNPPIKWDYSVEKAYALECAIKQQRITRVNDAMLTLYGVSREELINPSNPILKTFTHDKDLLWSLFDNSRLHIETEVYKANGKKMWIEGDYICLHNEAKQIAGYFGIQRDVTERREQALALQHKATHDPLTNLPNRLLLYDRVHYAMFAGQRGQNSFALILMDLDSFKEVNDTYGHHIGDAILKQVSIRLQGLVRESDTIARLGGDEFAVLLPTVGEEGAARSAVKILQAYEEVFVVDELSLKVGASLGIALWPDHGNNVDTLLRRADRAMYTAKQARSGYAVYKPLLSG